MVKYATGYKLGLVEAMNSAWIAEVHFDFALSS